MSSTEIENDAAEAGPQSDESREAWAAQLADTLGDGFVEHHTIPDTELWVRVTRDSWIDAATAARDLLGCQFFDWLSAIDWLPSPYGRDMDAQEDNPQPKAADPMEQGHAGGQTRFQMVMRLYSITDHMGITIKADLPNDDLSIDSLIQVYPGSNWHEREAWEMFGIHFNSHPDLRHIYLPGEFEGNPLRKDFPLLARRVKPWPGIVDVELFPGEEGP
ncbi:NADH-quinone oxidoreductase subunit C [Candidatus Poriferisocius sp.]|uniref:NADH-quinone oxidoreductase subunit C n=1 Tax=Candidatus Poriferisocius sp. TaxID=3101276 RepID=UPI003B525E9C